MISTMRRLRRSERGAAMIEFAIVLPVLLLFICGIIDFGRALWAVNALTSAAREGGRWAASQDQPSIGAIKDTVIARIPGGNGGTLLTGGTALTAASNVTVCVDGSCSGTITNGVSSTIQVNITGVPFQAATPLPGLMGLSSITLPTISASFRYERGP
ncbi:MAG TPA: TadE/TadG family type IV pilus assembly protein [Gemmatimonadaceae bacterium]|nr:TadE/TadG family type IV pilus assembly protein [Gemmatimonadaceae bacterium]